MSKAQTSGMLDLYDFVKVAKIIHPVRGPIEFSPFDFQIEMIRHIEDNPLSVINGARQMGHTTAIMAWALWTAAAKPNMKIAVVNYREYYALENLERARYMLQNTVTGFPYVHTLTKKEISFSNGSSIVQRSSTPLRDDEHFTHVVFTDAGYFHAPMNIFWQSLLPHLHRGGTRCVMQGTGGHTNTVFHNVVENAGRNGFALLTQNWRAHPDRDDAWANVYRDQLGYMKFMQEFENQFTSAG